ncbi:MAG: tetratricopeptide repeat protein [Sedimentisphaerales bacterium]|nr:tetratricopeptide repeat protein [Sedimentisphaerales bacterium]
MFRKVELIPLVLFIFVLSGMAGECFADASVELEQAKSNILSLIREDNYARARAQTHRLLTDFPKKPALTEALYSIAQQYELSDKYDDANDIYQQMMKTRPDNTWIGKAKLGVARTEVLSLIMANNSRAKEAFDKLVKDFSGHPDLPETLYYVARRYEWADKYEDAKAVYYQQMTKGHHDSPYTGKAKLGVARTNVLSLIMSQNNVRAKKAFDKLAADFSGHPDLPDTLYWIARRYEWADKYEDAKSVYQQLTQSVSDDDPNWADRSKLGFARANILSLILSRKYDQAKDALNKLFTEDFSNHPDFPDALYWIAERYKWSGRYEDAKNFYQQIIQNYPRSSFANRAKLGISRADVQLRIRSDDSDAKKSFDKLVADFNDHPDLPETLYWVAEKYSLSDKYEEEKAVYERILQNYPDSPYAGKAKLGLARANILFLILSQNYDQAKDDFNQLLAGDFAGHPDFPATLHSIARRYEWARKYEDAKAIYQQIIQDYPDGSYAGKAKLGLSRAEVGALVDSQDYDGADAAFDKMVSDFNNHPDLPRAILASGEQYYKEGLSKESAGLQVQARDRFEKAVQMWEKVITKFPDPLLVPEACCWAGDCYFEKLSQYEDSIRCFQEVVDKYPGYQHAWHAQFMIGRSYEILRDTADAHIKAAYERIIRNYPDSSAAEYAGNWLSQRVKVEKER